MTTNREFLNAFFPGVTSWVCHYQHDPDEKQPGQWAGAPLLNGEDVEWPHDNAYFSIMSVRDPKAGRTDANFNALHVVMIDDIGTKVTRDKLPGITPTWVLQTSVKNASKNFQYGYALVEPCTDQPRAKRLINHLTACGYSDKGASGVNRYARLPVGSNTKGGKEQPHDLFSFDPSIRYSIEQLEQAFGVDTKPNGEKRREPFNITRALDGVPESDEDGGRDSTLYSYAHSMQARGTPKDEALVLIEHAASNCMPPFDVRKARQMVEAAYEKFGTPVTATFDSVMASAGALTRDSAPDAINVVLRDASAARLNPVERDKFLRAMKASAGTGIGDLKAMLRQLAQQDSAEGDLGLAVMRSTLETYYESGEHIVRTQDGCFWTYTGTHWQRATDEQVRHNILRTVEASVSPEAASFSGLIDSAFRLMVADRAASGDVLRLTEEPRPVINCVNGELWIADDGAVELRAHHADSFLTYVLGVTYDPQARCPRFDRAMTGVFWLVRRTKGRAAQMVRHFNEIVGYAIQPRRDIPSWFMFIGPGQNAKTKVTQTLTEHLINFRAVFADRISDIEGNKFKRGALAGKLVLLDDDVDAGTKLPDGFLKCISERKLLTGEHKFRDSFEFIACCVPILLANNPPTSKDLSWGLRRRAQIVPFSRVFHKDRVTAEKEGDPRAVADTKLFPYIWQHEMSGVLNRALAGLQRLRARGRFDEPHACIEARREWLAAANPLVAFIQEGCESDAGASVLLGEFYEGYTGWARESGIRSIEPRNTIKRGLEGLGYKTAATGHGTAVRGLRVVFTPTWGGVRMIKLTKLYQLYPRGENKSSGGARYFIFIANYGYAEFRKFRNAVQGSPAGVVPPSTTYPARRISPRPQADVVSGYMLDFLALVAARANRSSDYATRIPARYPPEGPRP